MLRASEQLETVSSLSEQTPMLRVLAAKLEPFAEAIADHAASIGKYGDGQTASEEQKAKTQAEKEAWAAPAGELLEVVDELRALADRVDGALGTTRGLLRDSHRDMLEALSRPIGAG